MSIKVAEASVTRNFGEVGVRFGDLVEYVETESNYILTLENGTKIEVSWEDFFKSFAEFANPPIDFTVGEVYLVNQNDNEPVTLGMVIEKRWWKTEVSGTFDNLQMVVVRQGTVMFTNSTTVDIDSRMVIPVTTLSKEQILELFTKGGCFFGDRVTFDSLHGGDKTGIVTGWDYYRSYGPAIVYLQITTSDDPLPESCRPEQAKLIEKGPIHIYYNPD